MQSKPLPHISEMSSLYDMCGPIQAISCSSKYVKRSGAHQGVAQEGINNRSPLATHDRPHQVEGIAQAAMGPVTGTQC